ncbi:MAG: YkgJ family cysteine cluster protein, partial [Spirochaetales bacterium]|nr:YkgJ family cysteine cluster protein [Spirochaetales bacterium]
DSGYVFLSEDDLARLLEFTDLTRDEFIARYAAWAPFGVEDHLSLTERDNKDCVFWTDGGCSVYPSRPLQCRTYPFWSHIVDSEEHWMREAAECPGVDIGPRHGGEDISAALRARRAAPPVHRPRTIRWSGE